MAHTLQPVELWDRFGPWMRTAVSSQGFSHVINVARQRPVGDYSISLPPTTMPPPPRTFRFSHFQEGIAIFREE